MGSSSKETNGIRKSLGGIGAAIVVIAIAFMIPGSEALSHEGITTLGVLLALAILWATAALPVGVIALCIPVTLFFLGVCNLSSAFAGYGSTALYFIIAIFAMPVILQKTAWGTRLISQLVEWAKDDSKKLVLGFMVATGLISTIMSDVPTTVLFLSFALPLLKAANAKPGSSNLGRCLMIGIPVAAVIGGIATPAGSSFNVVAMGLMQQSSGEAISFLNWMVVCAPLAIVMLPLSWFFIVKVFEPESISDECFEDIRSQAEMSKQITAVDIKALVIIGLMVVLWIAGNWITVLSATAVALVGLVVMFLPGMNLITWKEFQDAVPWGIVLMVGTIMSIGGVVSSTGGAAFIANVITGSGVVDAGFMVFFFVILLVVYLFHTVCPIGAAILGIFVPILITLCAGFGISPAVPTIALAIMVAGNVLLPVNPTVMLTYGEGYYKFLDMFKTGVVPAIILLILVALWVPFMVGVLGM